MAAPLIWAGVALAGLFLGKETLSEVEGAASSSARLVKWATIGGGVYVSYRALKASGALK